MEWWFSRAGPGNEISLMGVEGGGVCKERRIRVRGCTAFAEWVLDAESLGGFSKPSIRSGPFRVESVLTRISGERHRDPLVALHTPLGHRGSESPYPRSPNCGKVAKAGWFGTVPYSLKYCLPAAMLLIAGTRWGASEFLTTVPGWTRIEHRLKQILVSRFRIGKSLH